MILSIYKIDVITFVNSLLSLVESNYGRGTLWAITIQSAPVPVVSGYTSDTTSAIPR